MLTYNNEYKHYNNFEQKHIFYTMHQLISMIMSNLKFSNKIEKKQTKPIINNCISSNTSGCSTPAEQREDLEGLLNIYKLSSLITLI